MNLDLELFLFVNGKMSSYEVTLPCFFFSKLFSNYLMIRDRNIYSNLTETFYENFVRTYYINFESKVNNKNDVERN